VFVSIIESSTTWEQSWEQAKPRLSLRVPDRRLLLLVGDVLFLGLAGLAAISGWSLFRPDIQLTSEFIGRNWWLPFVMGLAWLILAAMNSAYDLQVAAQLRRISRKLLFATVAVGLFYAVIFVIFSTRGAPGDPFAGLTQLEWRPPRVVPAFFLLGALIFTLVWRAVYASVFTSPNFRRRVLVVGAGWAGRTITEAVRSTLESGYEVLGFIDDDPAKQDQSMLGVPVLGTSEDMLHLALKNGVDELVLAITHGMQGETFGSIMDCYAHGITLVPMPLLFETATGRVPVEHIDSQWYVSLPTYPATTARVSDILQRLGDILLSLVGLSILLPFLPLIALIIYLDSPGPIFYSQVRAGRNGRPFRLYKFRSMIPNAEAKGEAVWAQEDDPRITRFGKFMRRTRLDELPQLLNVFKGDMSVIGPRPERPEFIAELEEEIPFYSVRHLVRPGLSGWAQVKYRYGNSKEDALMKLQYDLYYIKHRSPFLNLLILWRTVGVVLRFEGT
jgi:exopolysaccharide biosynthesis polyprenyl glycosylphosphotransferase